MEEDSRSKEEASRDANVTMFDSYEAYFWDMSDKGEFSKPLKGMHGNSSLLLVLETLQDYEISDAFASNSVP